MFNKATLFRVLEGGLAVYLGLALFNNFPVGKKAA